MTPNEKDMRLQLDRPAMQNLFREVVHERMLAAIRMVFVNVLEEEVTAFLGADRYQRAPGRQSRRCGYYTRDLTTSVGQVKTCPRRAPATASNPRLFERYQRRMAETKPNAPHTPNPLRLLDPLRDAMRRLHHTPTAPRSLTSSGSLASSSFTTNAIPKRWGNQR